MKKFIKKIIIFLVPLSVRKILAVWLNHCSLFDPDDRSYWATELLVDFARKDTNAYHKFLWKNHLSYAETYEIEKRFGYENLNETRKIFFEELPGKIQEAGLESTEQIDSILEVGCSLGYLLRHMETDVFPNANIIEGVDIDEYAIENGKNYLSSIGSRVKLYQGDMVKIPNLLNHEKYDFVLGSGVLLYLDEQQASEFVSALIKYTGKFLAITALAHPDIDNQNLKKSEQRERDMTWIHNVDKMITDAGGVITSRRWEGGEIIDGNTIYFLYAKPAV